MSLFPFNVFEFWITPSSQDTTKGIDLIRFRYEDPLSWKSFLKIQDNNLHITLFYPMHRVVIIYEPTLTPGEYFSIQVPSLINLDCEVDF